MGDETKVGIPISSGEFRRLVERYVAQMESGGPLQTDDYIAMTRVWNTIERDRLVPTDELFRRYYALFFPGFVAHIEKALGAIPTKGMALYAKDHDLYLGGKPHANSAYRIEGLDHHSGHLSRRRPPPAQATVSDAGGGVAGVAGTMIKAE